MHSLWILITLTLANFAQGQEFRIRTVVRASHPKLTIVELDHGREIACLHIEKREGNLICDHFGRLLNLSAPSRTRIRCSADRIEVRNFFEIFNAGRTLNLDRFAGQSGMKIALFLAEADGRTYVQKLRKYIDEEKFRDPSVSYVDHLYAEDGTYIAKRTCHTPDEDAACTVGRRREADGLARVRSWSGWDVEKYVECCANFRADGDTCGPYTMHSLEREREAPRHGVGGIRGGPEQRPETKGQPY